MANKYLDYKFRSSMIHNLMTNGIGGGVSKTTQNYLWKLWIKEEFGKVKELTNKYVVKGTFAEEDSLDLVTEVRGDLLIKNKETFENDYITGTPDVILEDRIIDIKTAWDIFTFSGKDTYDKKYYYQMQAYMWLTGLKKAELIYTLVNTPEHLITNEKYRVMYAMNLREDSEEWSKLEDMIDKNMKFDEIDKNKRLKSFTIEYDEGCIEKIKTKVVDARKHLTTLTF